MAFKLKVPSLEGLIRNRYTGRTFIEGSVNRKRKAETKYTPLPRSARRQAGAAGRGFDRPLDDDESADQAHSRAGPGSRDPRPRRLPADHRSLLLRHRHVDGRASCSPRSFCADGPLTEEIQAEMAATLGADSLRYLPVESICPGDRLRQPINSARPASPATILRKSASSSIRLRWTTRARRILRRGEPTKPGPLSPPAEVRELTRGSVAFLFPSLRRVRWLKANDASSVARRALAKTNNTSQPVFR